MTRIPLLITFAVLLVMAACTGEPPLARNAEKRGAASNTTPAYSPPQIATRERNRVLDPRAPGSNRQLARERGDTDEVPARR